MNIDLFASRLNLKIDKFVSWKADPLAWAVDAFTLTWNNIMFYAFPPFSIIDKVCHKIVVDRAEGVLIVPSWPTQNWYPLVMKLCLKPPYFIKPGKDVLILNKEPGTPHPLHKNLHLLVFHVSGQHFNNIIYQRDQYLLL